MDFHEDVYACLNRDSMHLNAALKAYQHACAVDMECVGILCSPFSTPQDAERLTLARAVLVVAEERLLILMNDRTRSYGLVTLVDFDLTHPQCMCKYPLLYRLKNLRIQTLILGALTLESGFVKEVLAGLPNKDFVVQTHSMTAREQTIKVIGSVRVIRSRTSIPPPDVSQLASRMLIEG